MASRTCKYIHLFICSFDTYMLNWSTCATLAFCKFCLPLSDALSCWSYCLVSHNISWGLYVLLRSIYVLLCCWTKVKQETWTPFKEIWAWQLRRDFNRYQWAWLRTNTKVACPIQWTLVSCLVPCNLKKSSVVRCCNGIESRVIYKLGVEKSPWQSGQQTWMII